MKRTYVVALLPALAAVAACGNRRAPPRPIPKSVEVAQALEPAYMAKALQRLGGAHLKSACRFDIQGQPGPVEVATATDLIVDRAGNYRFLEENDRDGGRYVVLYGRELAVALRYGKMIRRVAEEPEPTHLLEEALGGPWAAYEVVASRTRTTPAGTELYGGAPATIFELALADRQAPAKRPAAGERHRADENAGGLRAWRSTAVVEAVSGRALVDDATGALMKLDFSARFSAKGEGGPVRGSIDVHSVVSDMAAVPAVTRPEAEDLAIRQRIVPEQHELLRGLAQIHPMPEPPPRQVAPRRRGHDVRPGAPKE